MRKMGRWGLRLLAAAAGVIAAGCAYQRVCEARDAKRFPPPGERADVGGRRLHLVCQGTGNPTVLFEAGGTQFSTQYARVAREIGAHTRACAYDRAGMGWSDPSPRPLTAQSLASDVEALLTRAGIPPPYMLVGSSAGGLTVELFAREHPGDVVGLVLLDALTSNVVEAFPRPAQRRMAAEARLGCVLVRTGVLRWLDPLRRDLLPDGEREVAFALTYRASTFDAIASLVESADASLAELRSAPPLRADLPLVVVTHDPATDRAGESEEPRAVALARRAVEHRGAIVTRPPRHRAREPSSHHPGPPGRRGRRGARARARRALTTRDESRAGPGQNYPGTPWRA